MNREWFCLDTGSWAMRIVLCACLWGFGLLKLAAGPLHHTGTWAVLIWVAAIVEFLAGLLIVTPAWQTGAALTIVLGFAGLVVVVVFKAMGLNVSRCGCFGRLMVSETLHIIICVALVATAASLLSTAVTRKSGFPDIRVGA